MTLSTKCCKQRHNFKTSTCQIENQRSYNRWGIFFSKFSFSNFLFELFFSVSLRCFPRLSMCVVTGSTVIDFFNKVHSVTNRCTYSLIKPQGGSAFQLLAGFQERRQQNVMFLDHLILQLEEPDVVMYLGQGGLVEVRNIEADSFYFIKPSFFYSKNCTASDIEDI